MKLPEGDKPLHPPLTEDQQRMLDAFRSIEDVFDDLGCTFPERICVLESIKHRMLGVTLHQSREAFAKATGRDPWAPKENDQ